MLLALAQSDSRTMTVIDIARDGRKRNIKIGLSEDASRHFQLAG
jgi:hypothetical protein